MARPRPVNRPPDVDPRVVVAAAPLERGGKSLAEHVHDRVASPVLCIRGSAPRHYSEVVLAVDHGSAVDLMTAAARLIAPDVPLVYLHAYLNPYESRIVGPGVTPIEAQRHRAIVERDTRQRMRDYLAGWGASLDALRLEHGSAQEVLCWVPSTALLVLHRERGWLKHALWGSVSRAVLADGQADVLLVGDAR